MSELVIDDSVRVLLLLFLLFLLFFSSLFQKMKRYSLMFVQTMLFWMKPDTFILLSYIFYYIYARPSSLLYQHIYSITNNNTRVYIYIYMYTLCQYSILFDGWKFLRFPRVRVTVKAAVAAAESGNGSNIKREISNIILQTINDYQYNHRHHYYYSHYYYYYHSITTTIVFIKSRQVSICFERNHKHTQIVFSLISFQAIEIIDLKFFENIRPHLITLIIR